MTDSRGFLQTNELSERAGVNTSFWDYLTLLLSNLICVPFQILSIALTTRLLGTEGYGHIALYNMVIGLGFIISVDWTAGSVLRFGREEFELGGRMNQTFWARTAIMVPCLFLWLIFVVLFKDALCPYLGIPFWALGLLIGSVFVKAVHNYLVYILQAIRKMQAYAAVQVIGSVTAVVGITLIFFKVFPRNFLAVIILGIISLMVTIIITCIFWVPVDVLLPIKIHRTTLREIFGFSYPVILASASGYIVNWVDVIVINQYLTISHVGGYQVAYQVFTFTMTIIMTLNTLISPVLISFFANGREDLILRYAVRFVPQVSLVWSVVSGIGLAICPLVFPLVFGSQFGFSALYFQFLALGLALNASSVLCTGIIMTYKLIKLSMIVNVVMALLNLLGDLVLIPILGAVGAATSTSLAIGISALLNLLICQRRLKTNLCWQLSLTLPAFLSLGMSRLVPSHGISLLAVGTTLVAGYSVAKALHIFQHADLLFLNYVKMPALLRKAIVWFYPFLVSENQYRSSKVNS